MEGLPRFAEKHNASANHIDGKVSHLSSDGMRHQQAVFSDTAGQFKDNYELLGKVVEYRAKQLSQYMTMDFVGRGMIPLYYLHSMANKDMKEYAKHQNEMFSGYGGK